MKKKLFVLACLTLLSSFSLAALEQIVWGDFVGVTIKYNGISESSATDTLDINGDNILDSGVGSLDGLYGRPRLDGDTLAFDDLDFFSSSNGSGGVYNSDITDGKLAGQIEGKPNYYVNQIRFTEYGDATVNKPEIPGLTTYARAAISNSIFIKIQEIDGVDVPDIVLDPISMVVSPQGEWLTTGTFTWSGVVMVDITAILRDLGYDGYATKVDFTLDNTLSTEGYNGSASIAKKETGGLQVETFNQDNGIPEPATLALLGLGGLLLRRKK